MERSIRFVDDGTGEPFKFAETFGGPEDNSYFRKRTWDGGANEKGLWTGRDLRADRYFTVIANMQPPGGVVSSHNWRYRPDYAAAYVILNYQRKPQALVISPWMRGLTRMNITSGKPTEGTVVPLVDGQPLEVRIKRVPVPTTRPAG